MAAAGSLAVSSPKSTQTGDTEVAGQPSRTGTPR
uniref:Uncharacterized protein n=1 Tax=Tetraselmis sp. GSL018 TaxID=582737 RepID=A0A061QZD9_9CHLO